eukprot:12876403-Ditylum_brightwellii.AAC.1
MLRQICFLESNQAFVALQIRVSEEDTHHVNDPVQVELTQEVPNLMVETANHLKVTEIKVMSFWQPLTLNEPPVPEPENKDTSLCAPTEMEVDNPKGKSEFQETFSRPGLTAGKDTNMVRHRNRKYGLDETSYPTDLFNAIIPITPQDNLEDISEIDIA